jgi:hypothetical protein
MRVRLKGSVTAVNGITYSFADSKREGTKILLPKMHKNRRLYIPGGSIRGKIRHCCVHMIAEKLLEHGNKLSLDDLYLLFLGGIKQGGDTNFDQLTGRRIYQQNPVIRNFGAMDPIGIRGNWQIESALANLDVEPDIIFGQRTDPVQRGEIHPDDLADPTAYNAYIDKLKSDQAKRKKPDESTDVSTNMPFSREIIPIGSVLPHEMNMTNVGDVDLGMFLATLRFFSNDPYFCAQLGQNLGLVDLAYEVIIDRKPVGEIAINGRERSFILDDDLAKYENEFWGKFETFDFRRPTK